MAVGGRGRAQSVQLAPRADVGAALHRRADAPRARRGRRGGGGVGRGGRRVGALGGGAAAQRRRGGARAFWGAVSFGRAVLCKVTGGLPCPAPHVCEHTRPCPLPRPAALRMTQNPTRSTSRPRVAAPPRARLMRSTTRRGSWPTRVGGSCTPPPLRPGTNRPRAAAGPRARAPTRPRPPARGALRITLTECSVPRPPY